jgi:diadenosine tetraphosphate (Ap4A) HIT family hydrolase
MIAEKKIPSKAVYEDESIYVFHDIDPQAPVHVLMVPKKHISSTETIQPEDADIVAHMMLKIKEVSALLGLSNGYRVVMNCGEDGMQTVSHLHMHILGKRKLTWPPG